MSLHRLTTATLGVPDPAAAAEFYAEFGLTPTAEGSFATRDGGEQLRVVESPKRRLVELGLGVESQDDLGELAAALAAIEVGSEIDGDTLRTTEAATDTSVVISVAPRIDGDSAGGARRTTSRAAPSASVRGPRASSARAQSAPASSVTWSSARPIRPRPSGSSPRASASR